MSSPLYAEEPAVVKEVKETPAFRGVASLSLRSSTTNSSDYSYRIFLSPAVNLEYEFTDVFTVGLSARANKDLNNEQRYSMTDLSLSLSRSFELTENLGVGVDVSYGAPVSKDLYRYSNSKGTLGASGSVSYRFTGVLTGLAVNGGLSYERYLYEYQYANGGAILTKWAASQSYGISYTLQDWTLSGSFSNVTSWDFDGSQENDSFLAVETLQYKINDYWAVQAGHINDGTTYDYLGARNNVRFYDKRRSQVFVGTSYRF
ncbi:MAG: hypothetical protein EOP07_01665 [Proteobacteria bacterium]|nr:MAG: hypothetical protein EOP07_01665 [Pseudomonadota bacterium]